ncbi:MAG TPA: DnaJ domain-containing protein, partial [Steroidobacteraceae bacterium]
MEYRDYYKILGVDRGVSAAALKSAYRRLARKFHPDVSKEANAEARFKEVQEAYEVLKDPEKRAAYDQLGADWKSGEQFRPPPDWGSGYEFSGGPRRPGRDRGSRRADNGGQEEFSQADFSDFFSSLFGGGSPFGGAGYAEGSGRPARDHHARVDIELEEAFRGATRTLELRRPEAGADGRVELRNHTVRVTIPPGVTEGQMIRLAGQGAPAAGGGSAGDLYLEAHILPNRRFALDGRDVTL